MRAINGEFPLQLANISSRGGLDFYVLRLIRYGHPYACYLLTHIVLRYFVRSEPVQYMVRQNHHGKRSHDILYRCFQGPTPLPGVSPEYKRKYQWCESARETSRQYRTELRQEYCKAKCHIVSACNIRKYARYCAHSETLIRRSHNFFVQPNAIRVFGGL